MASVGHAVRLSQLSKLRAKRWVRALFVCGLPFWVCGSAAWFGVLAFDITAERIGTTHYLQRAQYLLQLACRYSSLFLGPLIAVHSARVWWLRHSARADTWLSLLLAAALAPQCYRQAYLLSSGSLLFESEARLGSLLLIVALLLGAELALWHVHLALVRAPRHLLAEVLARRPRWLRALLGLSTVTLGVGALYAFSETVSRELRAYLFLSEFLLPSAFLFAASLLYGIQRRTTPWLSLGLALLICVGLSTGLSQPAGVRRARAYFERRAGLIALTDLASGRARGAPYANIDISHPERFHCDSPAEPAATPAPAPPDHRNVILISVDTLRKDALYTKDQAGFIAPSLRSIAKQSLSFDRAVTTYPATLFAVSSALTGQSPSELMFAPKRPENLFSRTRSRFQQLTIALPNAGWFKRPPVPQLFTQAVTPHYFPDAFSSTSYVLRRLREARARKRSTFTWIHYYEPHTTHVQRGKDTVRLARHSYAQLVRGVDTQIGRLWRELERLGYLRDSLVIIFSDHGEALGEFGYFGHHVYLNWFATDVPLIVHAPQTQPRRSEQLALLSDIAPTVLEWLGLPSDTAEARNLLALSPRDRERVGVSEAFPVRGSTLYDVARATIRSPAELAERLSRLRTAAIDYQPKVSLVSARYRLIVNRVTGGEEFYDRVKDPHERRDRAPDKLRVYRRMRKTLKAIMQARSERIYCKVKQAARTP